MLDVAVLDRLLVPIGVTMADVQNHQGLFLFFGPSVLLTGVIASRPVIRRNLKVDYSPRMVTISFKMTVVHNVGRRQLQSFIPRKFNICGHLKSGCIHVCIVNAYESEGRFPVEEVESS